MTLAQAVFEIFCSQASIWVMISKTEKGDNSFMILGILPKVNQVIYTLDTICAPNIKTVAQVVLEIFCSQSSIGLQCNENENFEKGNNSAMTNLMDKKKITGLLNFHTLPTYQISSSCL